MSYRLHGQLASHLAATCLLMVISGLVYVCFTGQELGLVVVIGCSTFDIILFSARVATPSHIHSV